MKITLPILIIVVIILVSYGSANSQWITNNPSFDLDMYAVQMVNGKTAYAVGGTLGEAPVIKTTNGGLNWSPTSLNTNVILYDLTFLNDSVGFVSGQSGAIYKTTNGGINWTLTPTRTNRLFTDIDFVDVNTGYGCGLFGMARRTTNGGVSWDTLTLPNSYNWDGLDFINGTTGFIYFGSILYKTTNLGNSWNTITVSFPITGLTMLNTTTGYMTGNFATSAVHKTTNGGINWFSVTTSTPLPIEGITFLSENTGFLYGGYYAPPQGPAGFIKKTTNGGLNWYEQSIPVHKEVRRLSFGSQDTAIAVTGDTIMRTINGGGTTSIQQISSNIPKNFSLGQNYPNPFNPSTKIEFVLPQSHRVRLMVYNSIGKKVAVLVNERLSAGTYIYDWNASGLPSGVYFYGLEAGEFTEMKKMILIK